MPNQPRQSESESRDGLGGFPLDDFDFRGTSIEVEALTLGHGMGAMAGSDVGPNVPAQCSCAIPSCGGASCGVLCLVRPYGGGA